MVVLGSAGPAAAVGCTALLMADAGGAVVDTRWRRDHKAARESHDAAGSDDRRRSLADMARHGVAAHDVDGPGGGLHIELAHHVRGAIGGHVANLLPPGRIRKE